MLHSRFIVVKDFPDGKTETVYQGPDSVEADKAFQKALKDNTAEAVLEFCHPMASRLRYPLQEKASAEEAAARREAAKSAQGNLLKDRAVKKREAAKQLMAEAKKLEAEAAEQLDPDKSSKK